MKLENPTCLNCSVEIPRENINLASDVAICNHCNTHYKFSSLLYGVQDNSHKTNTAVHDGFLYEDFKITPTISLELRKLSSYKFHLIMFLFVCMFGIVFIIIPDVVAKAFGLLFVALSFYLLKEGIFRYNTVYTIELRDDDIKFIQNGQITLNIQANNLAQVYIKRRNGGSSGSKVFYDHDIYVRPKSGEDVKVLKCINSSEVAFQIEQIIEKKYGIVDFITKEEYHPTYNRQVTQEIPKGVVDLVKKIHQ